MIVFLISTATWAAKERNDFMLLQNGNKTKYGMRMLYLYVVI